MTATSISGNIDIDNVELGKALIGCGCFALRGHEVSSLARKGFPKPSALDWGLGFRDS